MTQDTKQLLLKQWQTLHDSHESYEHYALIIKLIAVLVTVVAIIFSIASTVVVLLLAILCLQEGIWKTFQDRTAGAIIKIEAKLAEKDESSSNAYLFYSDWLENRSGAKALISEYIGNTLKPTVLYPYIPLMAVLMVIPLIKVL